VAASEAHPQFHPAITGFQAVFAAFGAGLDVLNLACMLAFHVFTSNIFLLTALYELMGPTGFPYKNI